MGLGTKQQNGIPKVVGHMNNPIRKKSHDDIIKKENLKLRIKVSKKRQENLMQVMISRS